MKEKTEKRYTVKITETNLTFGKSPCDTCGSHGSAYVSYICKGCGHYETFYLEEY